MKAILVIDMPKNCAECKLMFLQGIGESICNVVDWEERPKWCPLRPLPKKERELGYGRYTNYYLYRCGWNDCIDAILEPNSVKGETE